MHLQFGHLDLLNQSVSILARPEGRALRDDGDIISAHLLFQSSPVPKDGRYAVLVLLELEFYRFNPRPSRRTGAT